MYVVNSVGYKYDSPKNMAVRQRFANHEVLADLTEFVEYMLDASLTHAFSPVKWSEVELPPPVATCPYCGEAMELDATDTMDGAVTILRNEDADTLDEMYLCPVCCSGHPSEEEARKCCYETATVYVCEHCKNAMTDNDVDYLSDASDPNWWLLVSAGLGAKLLEHHEVVLKHDDLYLWGRCMSKEAVWHDAVIGEICHELEILDGQPKYKEVKQA